jgi:hypothetical protein
MRKKETQNPRNIRKILPKMERIYTISPFIRSPQMKRDAYSCI